MWWKDCQGQETWRSLRYVLKHATGRGSNLFQLFDTSEKPNHFVASRRGWLESQGRDGARQENGQNEWYDLGYQGAMAKAPPCQNSTLQTPLPQQSSSSAREEEDQWDVMEDKRRRRIAFENLAKGMLRYLDDSKDVKMGITELQEQVGVPLQFGISIQQVAQQAMNENGQKIFENILAMRRRSVHCQLGQMGGAATRLSRVGKKMSRRMSGNTDSEQKTRNIQRCD